MAEAVAGSGWSTERDAAAGIDGETWRGTLGGKLLGVRERENREERDVYEREVDGVQGGVEFW